MTHGLDLPRTCRCIHRRGRSGRSRARRCHCDDRRSCLAGHARLSHRERDGSAQGARGSRGDIPRRGFRHHRLGGGFGRVRVDRVLPTGQAQFDQYEDEPEVPDSIINSVIFYVRTLAVPARRKIADPAVVRGKEIFTAAKCASCHIPTAKTKTDVRFPEASNQTIRPYTDLLLHDMDSSLADNRPTYKATGTEWRTPPLWGIGLTQIVNGHNYFLHDGRARSLMEAVMWHGGEAQPSVNYVKGLSSGDREALVAFLKSL